MLRGFYLLFAVVAYGVFLATFLYLIGFVADLPILPRTVDSGRGESGTSAIVINLALIALFGLQHSVMARQGFKKAWTRFVPAPVERSAYVLFASIALIVLFAFWQPIPAIVWQIDNSLGRALLWGLFGVGWLIVLTSTFLINHFELFGLQQAWLHARQRAAAPPAFRTPFFYRFVRHPLYTGFFIAFWATPTMTQGHLLLATGMSVYMLIAIMYEERDLVALFGREYEDYRHRVGKLVPRLRH